MPAAGPPARRRSTLRSLHGGPLPPRHPLSPLETRQEAAPMLYGSGRVEARLLRLLRVTPRRIPSPRPAVGERLSRMRMPERLIDWGAALSTAVPPRRSTPATARYGCFFAYSNFGRALMASLVAPGRMNLLS